MSNGAKSSSSAPTIVSLLLGVAVAIFIYPTWTKLFEIGQYGWFVVFGILVPLASALLFYLILRALGWGLSAIRR